MTSVPTIAELLMAGDESRWRAAGFAVDTEAAVQIGTVALRIDGLGFDGGADADPGITAWTLRGAEHGTDIDGLATAWTAEDPGDPAEHPNGITAIDHLVILTSDLDRTIDALAACGLELRRIREGPAGDGTPVRQAFFRMAEVILELVAVADGPTRFWGLTFVASDLGHTLEWFGDGISEPRAAVQPGRRIATVRASLGLGLPVAVMDIAR
jgi:catechol 2,3-dioxygenase-like lactoylglutathione lyase family enzyme